MSKMKGGTTQYDFYSCFQTHTHLPHTPNMPTSHYTLFSEGGRRGGCQDMTQALLAWECDRFLFSVQHYHITHGTGNNTTLSVLFGPYPHLLSWSVRLSIHLVLSLTLSITNSTGLAMLWEAVVTTTFRKCHQGVAHVALCEVQFLYILLGKWGVGVAVCWKLRKHIWEYSMSGK